MDQPGPAHDATPSATDRPCLTSPSSCCALKVHRHFPERALLAKTVYEQRLDRLQRVGPDHAGDPQVFVRLLHELLDQVADTPGLLGVLREQPNSERYIRPLSSAPPACCFSRCVTRKAAAVLRADLEVEDLQILLAMSQPEVSVDVAFELTSLRPYDQHRVVALGTYGGKGDACRSAAFP